MPILWDWMLVVTMGGVELTMAGVFWATQNLRGSWDFYINLLESSNMEEVTLDRLGRKTLSMLSWGVSRENSLIVVEGMVWIIGAWDEYEIVEPKGIMSEIEVEVVPVVSYDVGGTPSYVSWD